MAQTAHPTGHPTGATTPTPGTSLRSRLIRILDSDGRPHPLENTLALVTVVLGSLALATVFFRDLHIVSSWVGLAGIGTAGWGQYISATTGERFLLIIFGGAAAIGLGIGLAHGGLI
jgi:hypothetical protein